MLGSLFIQQAESKCGGGDAYEIYVWYVREQLDTLSHEMSHVSRSNPFFIFLEASLFLLVFPAKAK